MGVAAEAGFPPSNLRTRFPGKSSGMRWLLGAFVELVVNGIVNTATPWSLYKQGTSNTWMPGGPPIGGGAAPPDGRGALLRMVNPATVMAADHTVTVAAPSSSGRELPLPRSATGGETSRPPLA